VSIGFSLYSHLQSLSQWAMNRVQQMFWTLGLGVSTIGSNTLNRRGSEPIAPKT
jgi:hypothetical protein